MLEREKRCENCAEWGDTVANGIPCSKCGRHTHPNLGVNMPAGAAVAWSTTRCVEIQEAMGKPIDFIYGESRGLLLDGQARLYAMQKEYVNRTFKPIG